ncbi:hypothetical protein M422DRAFT_185246 [Sphaerobolus stellatus SS14]|uniref:DUF4218 domain-containing protein n=1 Tax=Sphaerobolus stellatus (strain SS14) TaxID=990650 RepID=A0A0C9UBE8_SPHS4|nr:hypothetical protein M422DRAFT_185246 [Sphaerobolus stellatus SS14]
MEEYIGAALVPLIADYPAIRKALGVKISPRADLHFCIFCDIPRTQMHEWLDTDPKDYPRRNDSEHRRMAFEWRDAPNPTAQENVFKRNGIRYTELLRLPYWDPTRFIVVDPMHNLFLGLIQSHFRGFLGIKAGDGETRADRQHGPQSPDDDDEPAHNGGVSTRAARPSPTPRNPPHTSIPGVTPVNGNRRSRKMPPMLGPSDISEIQHDIKHLVTPTWVTALPHNFGTAKAGTLKADVWKSALHLYLPFTMIRLWGNLPQTDRRKMILDNTMTLLQAVYYASANTMTEAKAKMYTESMLLYLKGLCELFPDKNLLPNHHMALHIEECLMRFGPIRGWWAFPIERLIGAFQHINTNWKFGEPFIRHNMNGE